MVVKNLLGLLRGITSSHKEDFYCLNCFRSYRTRNKLEVHKKICENHDYCNVEMSTKDNNIIKYNQGEKSIKLPFVVYADLECLLEKMSTCQNNPNESSTTEINKYTPSVIHYLLIVHLINREINSIIIDNLSEGIHNNKCDDCESCLDYIRTKNEKLIFKCFNCKQYYEKDFNKELIKRFAC